MRFEVKAELEKIQMMWKKKKEREEMVKSKIPEREMGEIVPIL